MKAFKSWWKKYKELHPKQYWPIFDFLKPSYKKGWQEALLWYYKTAEHLSPSDCDLIDKELGNETKKP